MEFGLIFILSFFFFHSMSGILQNSVVRAPSFYFIYRSTNMCYSLSIRPSPQCPASLLNALIPHTISRIPEYDSILSFSLNVEKAIISFADIILFRAFIVSCTTFSQSKEESKKKIIDLYIFEIEYLVSLRSKMIHLRIIWTAQCIVCDDINC